MHADSNRESQAHAAEPVNGRAAWGLAEGRTEAELVDASVQGDTAAFAALYDQYVDRVYRHCYYRAGNRADAEDFTQQTFLQAWQAIRRYRRGQTPFIAWLLTISHHLAISHRRKAREIPAIVEPPSRLDGDPEETVMTDVVWDLVRHAILRLKPERQAVILLRYVEGFSVSEVAEALGKTENNIRVIQHRALADLRQLMAETESAQPVDQNPIDKLREIASSLLRKVYSRPT